MPKWQSISIQANIVRPSVNKSHLRDTPRDTHGAITALRLRLKRFKILTKTVLDLVRFWVAISSIFDESKLKESAME